MSNWTLKLTKNFPPSPRGQQTKSSTVGCKSLCISPNAKTLITKPRASTHSAERKTGSRWSITLAILLWKMWPKIKHRKNCECCPCPSLFKGHKVIVSIVVLNCQQCNQCTMWLSFSKSSSRDFSSFAPIFLRFNNFRHNIWRFFYAQIHFWYIFGYELNTAYCSSKSCQRISCNSSSQQAGCEHKI